jgi:hypothetical protein
VKSYYIYLETDLDNHLQTLLAQSFGTVFFVHQFTFGVKSNSGGKMSMVIYSVGQIKAVRIF